MKEGRGYLGHMLERADRILRFIEPGRETFMSYEQIQDSVIRNLEIIGEAARRVPPELRAELPDVCLLRPRRRTAPVPSSQLRNVAPRRSFGSGHGQAVAVWVKAIERKLVNALM